MKTLLILIPLMLCACSKETRANVDDNGRPPLDQRGVDQRGGVTPPADRGMGDQTMADTVRRAIQADTMLANEAKNVMVDVRAGVVTLTGTVRTEQNKNAVADKARSVSGTSTVSNLIEVKPD